MTSAQDSKGENRGSLFPNLLVLQFRLLSSAFNLCPQILHRTHHLCSEMAGVEGKRKSGQYRTRTTMDFDPMPKILRSQKELDGYLARYGVRLPSNVKVEWYPPDTDYTEAPEAGGVYLHPQLLALGLKFPLTNFVRDLLRHYRIAPSQLWVVDVSSWASKPSAIVLSLMPAWSRTSSPSM